MSDRKHPYTPMQRTDYGYTSSTELRCCGELEQWMKKQQKEHNHEKNKRKWKGKNKHVKS
ncbi:hypothetical protein OQI89_10645 [Lentilactobacillus diolivorans]|uniref:hypothetical protein n=1 Tax=Lentilactobacillus diolivorans TaxID=179838 RepID=UPI002468984E|nr:hypothetical protein [Lentilactobacillus diolivorans]MDH5106309.1 hypothetical protein [Lentilactobacillus diolivorans]